MTPKIPKRFTIFNETITVEFDPQLSFRQNARGEVRYRESRILLAPNSAEYPRSEEKIFQAFCHELTHIILCRFDDFRPTGNMGDDEFFVDLFASILAQAWSTMEYEP